MPQPMRVCALCAVLATLLGCGREDAADTRADVATVPSEAATQVAEAGQDARATAAEGAYEVAVAQAEGAHRVALERCEASTGDQRLTCRDRADADLQLAKDRAQQARDGRN